MFTDIREPSERVFTALVEGHWKMNLFSIVPMRDAGGKHAHKHVGNLFFVQSDRLISVVSVEEITDNKQDVVSCFNGYVCCYLHM